MADLPHFRVLESPPESGFQRPRVEGTLLQMRTRLCFARRFQIPAQQLPTQTEEPTGDKSNEGVPKGKTGLGTVFFAMRIQSMR